MRPRVEENRSIFDRTASAGAEDIRKVSLRREIAR
jgi:hypothetical protein